MWILSSHGPRSDTYDRSPQCVDTVTSFRLQLLMLNHLLGRLSQPPQPVTSTPGCPFTLLVQYLMLGHPPHGCSPSSYNSAFLPLNSNIFTKSYTCMFIAELLIIIKKWEQPKCPSADKWMNKLWYIYTME